MKKSLLLLAVSVFAANAAFGGSLTLNAPDGGELCLGRNLDITWTASGLGAGTKVKLILFKDGERVGLIAEDLEAGGSPYPWEVGRHRRGTAPTGSGYTVCLRTMDNAVEDCDNAAFTIKECLRVMPPSRGILRPPPIDPSATTVRVTYPNGGERLVIGEEATITWECTNARPGQYLNVSLVTHPGSPIEETFNLGNMPVTAGSYAWDITPVFKATFDSLIRLSPRTAGDFTPDNSDRIFALLYPNTTVRILTPNGGESLPGSTPIHIRWEASNTKPWQCFKIRLVHMDSDCAHSEYSYDWGIWPIDQREARVPPEAYTREFSGLWKIAITVNIDRLHNTSGYHYPIALDESDACFRIH